MDGGGSIQVNHSNRQSIRYNLVIRLKNTPANRDMLQLVASNLGGRCSEVSGESAAVWAAGGTNKIVQLLKIFDRYPPLTTRVHYQIQFLRNMHRLVSQKVDRAVLMEAYFTQRALKYSGRGRLVAREASWFIQQPHFKEWLSGFIEVGGCFCVRTNKKKSSFSIGQKHDQDLLLAIRNYLATSATIRLAHTPENYYHFET